jgi:hypothetical protein
VATSVQRTDDGVGFGVEGASRGSITKRCHRVLAVAAAVACAAAVAVAAPAAAATYELSGTQVGVTPEWALNYGGLLGAWQFQTGTLDPASVPPIFHSTGTEKFYGCLNLNHDGSCYKEPSGTLSFSYEAWIKSLPPYNEDSEVWGACYHPITGGTGAFTGADGVLTMVDAPTPHGIHTRWQAVLTLPNAAQASARSAHSQRTRPRQLLRRLMRTRSARTAAIPRGSCGAAA